MKLSQEQIQQIRTEGKDRIDRGEISAIALAKEYGLHVSTVHYHLEKAEAGERKKPGPKPRKPYVFKKNKPEVITLEVPRETQTKAALVYGTPTQLAEILRELL